MANLLLGDSIHLTFLIFLLYAMLYGLTLYPAQQFDFLNHRKELDFLNNTGLYDLETRKLTLKHIVQYIITSEHSQLSAVSRQF